MVHGYKHVDGDFPLKNCAVDPKYREMVISWFTSNNKKELLAPYFQEIAKQTVDAAKDNDKVVLSHATYSEVCRDIVIETIVAGGVPREHITLVELTIDTEIKLRYLYKRTKRQAEQQGITIEQSCEGLEYEGDELSEDIFVKAMMKTYADSGGDWAGTFEPCPSDWKKVDVSGRDISHCDNLDKALGLTRSPDWTYESICDAVLPLDKARDAESTANGSMEEIGKIFAELSANPALKDDDKDTEEVKEIKQKRRSTLIQARSWKELDFSKIDLEDDK